MEWMTVNACIHVYIEDLQHAALIFCIYIVCILYSMNLFMEIFLEIFEQLKKEVW